jgi:hypothetical protein
MPEAAAMNRRAPALTALALLLAIPAGAAMPPREKLARPHKVEALIDQGTLQWFRGVTASHFTLPRWGGSRRAMLEIVALANKRGQTLVINGKGQSSMTFAALLVDRVEVRKPDAKWFGLHESTTSPLWQGNASSGYTFTVSPQDSEQIYRKAGIPNCLRWYRAQPEARTNAPRYVSWNFLERGCK